MRIVILGPGRIGSTLARFLTRAGHEVMLSAYRDEEHARTLAGSLGERACFGSLEEARQYGEVFFLAVPHPVAPEVIRALEPGRGMLVDCTNRFGAVMGPARSTTETLADLARGFIVVKAFNTLRADHLRTQADQSPPIAIPYSTDSVAGRPIIEALIRDCGYAPLDLGPLANGIWQQPDGPFFLKVLPIERAARLAEELRTAAGGAPSPP